LQRRIARKWNRIRYVIDINYSRIPAALYQIDVRWISGQNANASAIGVLITCAGRAALGVGYIEPKIFKGFRIVGVLKLVA
jgi:hypothetical protein